MPYDIPDPRELKAAAREDYRNRALRLHQEGLRVMEIARRLGRSSSWVSNVISSCRQS